MSSRDPTPRTPRTSGPPGSSRPRRPSFLVIATLLIGLSSLAGFAYLTGTGTIVGSPEKTFVPEDVRSRPGSYRSFHFWHVGYGGYRGGK